MAFFSFLSWFRPWWKTAETDYESILARLTKDIAAVQARLVRVNERERRASVTLTLYAILLWLAYAVFVWYSTLDERPSMSKSQRLQLWLPVLAGLVIIVSVRSVVRWWFRRVSDGEEKHLRSLQRARRKKVDEIKQVTRYDHLRTLVERYDDTASAGRAGMRRGPSTDAVSTLRPGSAGQQNPQTQQKQSLQPPQQASNRTEDRQFQGRKDGRPVNGRGALANKTNDPSQPASEGDRRGKVPPSIVTDQQHVKSEDPRRFEQPQRQIKFHKTWLDRVADKILGVEPSRQEAAEEQRYALICHVCFSHNGLCPKEDWEEVQYICPRCGTFNSRRPSSIPVSSPWAPPASASSLRQARFSGGDPGISPSRSLRELPPPKSPSTKSLMVESISAPSFSGYSHRGSEDEVRHSHEEGAREVEPHSEGAEQRQELPDEGSLSDRRASQTTADDGNRRDNESVADPSEHELGANSLLLDKSEDVSPETLRKRLIRPSDVHEEGIDKEHAEAMQVDG